MSGGASTNDQIKGGVVKGLLGSQTDANDVNVKRAMGFIQEFFYGKQTVDAAAGTLTRICLGRLTRKMLINNDVVAVPAAALTSSDTVPAVITLEADDGAGGSAVVIATLTTNTASGNWVAGVAKAFTLTAANVIVDGATATKYLWLNIAKTSTGTAVPVSSYCFSAELTS